MGKDQTIIDIVKSRPDLRAVLDELLEHGFLLHDLVNSGEYLRDVEQIMAAWSSQKSRLNAIAVGVSILYDLHIEIVIRAFVGKDPRPPDKFFRAIEAWKAEIADHFPTDHGEIESTCATLTQYLEYANRRGGESRFIEK